MFLEAERWGENRCCITLFLPTRGQGSWCRRLQKQITAHILLILLFSVLLGCPCWPASLSDPSVSTFKLQDYKDYSPPHTAFLRRGAWTPSLMPIWQVIFLRSFLQIFWVQTQLLLQSCYHGLCELFVALFTPGRSAAFAIYRFCLDLSRFSEFPNELLDFISFLTPPISFSVWLIFTSPGFQLVWVGVIHPTSPSYPSLCLILVIVLSVHFTSFCLSLVCCVYWRRLLDFWEHRGAMSGRVKQDLTF